jgi:hypothetical protein
MSDNTNLRRLAEAAQADVNAGLVSEAMPNFQRAATPEVVLRLLDAYATVNTENEETAAALAAARAESRGSDS